MNTPQQPRYNQLKAMLAISKASLRSISRSPSAVIFSIGFPLVFIVVFGFIRGNSIRLDVGVAPTCDTTNVIYRTVAQLPNIRLKSGLPQEQLDDQLIKGRIDAVLNIHPSDTVRVVEVITSLASREKGMFVKSVLTNLIDKGNLAHFRSAGSVFDSLIVARNGEHEPLAELRESEVNGREYKMIDFVLPGQLGFSILSAGVFGTAFVFFSLRQTLVLKRFFATPIRRTYIVLGEALSRLVFQLAGAMVIIVLGKYAFGFTLINGWTTFLTMLLLSAIGLVVFMGFGFVVSGIARNESTIPPIANIITLPQFLLSGTFFPVDAFPGWLQKIANVLPLTWLNDALRKIAFEGAGFGDISTHLLVILAWGIVVYAAAVRVFRWE